jgi:hypothetical protein
MTTKVTGTVWKVFPKTWPKGNTTYSVKLDDNPVFYRLGSNNFPGIVEPGNVVEFQAETMDEKSAKVVGAVAIVPKAQAAANAVATGAIPGDRQGSIVYQSSRKDALEYVKLVVASGAIKLPEKIAAKLKALDALLDQVTADFFNDVNTLGAISRASAGESEAEAPAEVPAKAASDEE